MLLMIPMKVAPGFLGSLFGGSRGCQLDFDAESLAHSKAGQSDSRLPLEAVTVATAEAGMLWSKITISTSNQRIALNGVVNKRASQFVEALLSAVSQAMLGAIKRHEPELHRVAKGMFSLLSGPRYLSHRDVECWKSTIAEKDHALLARILPIFCHSLLPREEIGAVTQACLDLFTDVMSGRQQQIKSRNARFVSDEICRCKEFFDGVEKTPLTIEQRIASVVFEDRNLLVAAAGSGKTSTIVGKIGYALLTKQYAPSDILVLAFNNDAATELDARIHSTLAAQLPGGVRIKTHTFHSLGLEIMAAAAGKKPSVANSAEGRGPADNVFVVRLVRQCIRSDAAFAADWVMFRTVCFKPARDPAEFDSLDSWNAFVLANGEYRNGKRGFLTIQGEIVKSQGELAIANWLYVQGVEYEYERPYEYDTADVDHRQYRPDFYFPAIETYLEHYALDKDGRPPAAFGKKYLESMEWKAQLHAAKATAMITTTFSDLISGELFPKLEKELKARGQPFAPRPMSAVLKGLNKLQKANFSAFLRTAMKHAKSNEIDEATLLSRADSSPEPYRARIFVCILWKLMLAYEAGLRQSGEIDFEDMIIQATHDVETNHYWHSFKLILIDECQDMSQDRANLIKALLTQVSDCKLSAVGDDWQSIYRFAGSDIDVFTRFANHFGVTATNYLTQTFRSNQGITDIAAAFVQKNPSQITKWVEAHDSTSEAAVVVRQYTTLEDMDRVCRGCLEEIAKFARPGHRLSVFLLARYRIQRPQTLEEWQGQLPMLEISFRSAHSSKGLEADYVIVLGLHTGSYAFPSEINDDPLLQLVMPQSESFPNAEERRLFYVAMTRARHGVYLLGSRFSPSAFLTELVEDNSIGTKLKFDRVAWDTATGGDGKVLTLNETCPQCRQRTLRKQSGKFGEFLGCSNYPSSSTLGKSPRNINNHEHIG
jgi:DNA helicase-4